VKTVASAFFASSTGLAGASFSRGEVALTEGETYYVEARYAARLTPYTMEVGNAYADGQAFRDGVAQPALDLSMTIVEYFEPEIVFDFSDGTVIPPGGVLDATINHLSGVLSPEGARVAGELVVTGGYRGSAAGGLRFDFLANELGGYDLLTFEGDVDLAGTLDLAVRPGFVPRVGEEFVLLTAPAVSGAFSDVVRSNVGDGLAFDVVVTETEVKVVVVSGEKPEVASLRAFPPVVASGGTATLSWVVTGADGVEIDQGVGDVTGVNSVDVSPVGDADILMVEAGSMWAVNDSSVVQPADWMVPGFDDSGWPVGPAEIGYGDGDEAAVWGVDPADPNKPITTYFRHRFEVGVRQLLSLDSLSVLLKRDDGAVVYLNGVEVARDNLPDPPAVIGPDTTALRGVGNEEERQFFLFDVAPRPLPLSTGTNVIAVEIHQSSPGSSDISMDLALVGTGSVREVEVSGVGETWRYADDGVDYFAPAVPFFDVVFDDSGWDSGMAEFGYGEGDEAGLWDFGGDAANKFPVYYARRRFEVPGVLASRATGGGIYVKADDGAAVFVNGGETMRSNLGPGVLDGATLAPVFERGDGGDFVFGEFGEGVLDAGENLVAASVHQSSVSSSDTSFDLRVVAQIPAATNVYRLSASNRFGTSEAMAIVEIGEPIPEDFRVTSVVRGAGGEVVVKWVSVAGASYRLERSADLQAWNPAGEVVEAAGVETEQTLGLAGEGEVYLRVVRLP
ncbi:MAG: hypothetical protein P8J87_10645, partial [Verrucomicrobiales bacterium]|nr:hypothetical protein [Verrucomicrobiales bacterium]